MQVNSDNDILYIPADDYLPVKPHGSFILDLICFLGNIVIAFFSSLFFALAKIFKSVLSVIVFVYVFLDKKLFWNLKKLFKDLRTAKKERKGLLLAARVEASQKNKSLLLTYPAMRIRMFRRQKTIIKTVTDFSLPLLSVIALVCVVCYFKNATYALAVCCNGKNIGYITDENVYNEALEMAEEKLEIGLSTVDNDVDDVFSTPVYSLNKVSKNMITDAETLCDRIIESSDYSTIAACGIYLDDEFLCAVKNETDAIGVFEGILSKKKVTGSTVDYVKNIDYRQGLYPDNDETIWSVEKLTDTAKNLSVKTIKTKKTVKYTPYDTVKKKSSALYSGDTKIIVQGEKGIVSVTTLETYIDGKLISSEIVAQKVIKEPVTCKMLVGTKKKILVTSDDGQNWDVGGGTFAWPVPTIRNITSYYGQRWGRLHAGIDISGGGAYGSEIIASASGVVESVDSGSSGYGTSLVINHGNGVKTRYAHCIAGSINVSVGQSVSKGQVIALLGNTGNSTGPHLHFEIIINGEQINPLLYL